MKGAREEPRPAPMERGYSYGTMFVNETAMPVRHVVFRDGLLVLYAEAPVRDMPAGMTNVRFHAPDGSLVFVAETMYPKVEVEGEADTLTIEQTVHLESASPGEPWAKGWKS